MNHKGNILISTIIIVILLFVLAGYYLYFKLHVINEPVKIEQEKQIIGGGTDEHGCIGPAGYGWCEAKQKCLRVFEEGCDDQIFELIDQVQIVSGIDFEAISTTTFDWMYETDGGIGKIQVDGLEFTTENVITEDYQKIEMYFTDNLEPDMFNMATGVTGGLGGYWYGYNVCLVGYEFTNFSQSEEGPIIPDTTSRKVKIQCGYLNKNDLPKISIDKQIKKLFAEKYNKKISAISLMVNQQIDDYARGGVIFLDEQGQAGGGGNFFAVKQTGEWQIVFDGNGAFSCQMLSDYNFPQDMQEGCFKE
ncbi:MAG: hypothetical protein ABIF17_02145 [Patescibacteria group bacterium]